MANFNGAPTGDTPANNEACNPESFSDTDDTARLPKLDDNINRFNGNNAPNTLSSTSQEQNSPETNSPEHKSHLRRNLVIGGVAVAVAVSAWIFGKSGDNVKPTSDANSGSAIAESYGDDNDLNNPVYNNDEIRSDDSEGGLLASQVINDYMTVNSGVDTMMASEYVKDWMSSNGYATPIAKPLEEGDYLLRGSGLFSFQCNDGTDRGATMIFGLMSTGDVDIIIRETSVDRENNKYSYSSDSIPTADEACEIAAQNLQ